MQQIISSSTSSSLGGRDGRVRFPRSVDLTVDHRANQADACGSSWFCRFQILIFFSRLSFPSLILSLLLLLFCFLIPDVKTFPIGRHRFALMDVACRFLEMNSRPLLIPLRRPLANRFVRASTYRKVWIYRGFMQILPRQSHRLIFACSIP